MSGVCQSPAAGLIAAVLYVLWEKLYSHLTSSQHNWEDLAAVLAGDLYTTSECVIL